MKTIITILFCVLVLNGTVHAQWSEQTSGVSSLLFSVSAVSDNVVWACGESGKVLRTVDAGVTWTTVTSPNSSLDFHCIQGIDAMNALVGGSGFDGNVYKTVDGGATWTQTFFQTGGFIDNLKEFHGFPGKYILHGDPVGGRWTIFISNDYGSTWDSTGYYYPAGPTEAGWNNSLFAATPTSTFWFGTNNTKLVQAYTSGTFTDRATTGLTNSYAVWGNDNNRLMAGGDLGLLYTVDQGATWTNTSAPGTGDISGIVGGRGTSKWYFVRGSSVYYSADDGVTWGLNYTTTGTYFHMSLSPQGGNMWAVRSNGGISRYHFDMPLPVELASFTSTVIGRKVTLNWSTLNETNNSGFEIERSSASGWINNTWTKIGFVNGNGTTTNTNNYTFTDLNLNSGKYNYRLKQIDYNGNFSYYNLQNDVIIGTPENFSLSQNYPNPFNPATKIDFEIPLDSKVTLRVYDMTGKEVKSLVNDFKSAGSYSVNFNGTDISSGIYVYRLTAGYGGKIYTSEKKMMLIK